MHEFLLWRRHAAARHEKSLCELCIDPSAAGNVFMGMQCNAVLNPRCVDRAHWDLGTGDNAWICAR
jgi:hypothetical protein